MRIYEKVKKYIDDNHLKQISIAREAGIPNPIFNAMLHGKRTMYADDLEKICKALNVSADIFINQDDQKSKTKPKDEKTSPNYKN